MVFPKNKSSRIGCLYSSSNLQDVSNWQNVFWFKDPLKKSVLAPVSIPSKKERLAAQNCVELFCDELSVNDVTPSKRILPLSSFNKMDWKDLRESYTPEFSKSQLSKMRGGFYVLMKLAFEGSEEKVEKWDREAHLEMYKRWFSLKIGAWIENFGESEFDMAEGFGPAGVLRNTFY